MTDTVPYRGRFAPSPTGPLHFGSLIAAVGSYLQARANDGEWWVRIEDIDPPREVAGASDLILASLEMHGLAWDRLSYQHNRLDQYGAALDALQQTGRLYPCTCSRRDIAASVDSSGGPIIYPGTCRDKTGVVVENHALRIDTRNAMIQFEDRIQGRQSFPLSQESGDFILRRTDGLFSYQLAVAIDDVEQGMTEVVRGCDLIGSTARQMHIHNLLGLASPAYAHLPVAVDPDTGHKLSKQTFARPLDSSMALENIWDVLDFLGQNPPPDLRQANLASLWHWAIAHWQLDAVPTRSGIDVKSKQFYDGQTANPIGYKMKPDVSYEPD
ncbi:MAG: tRNA glutamyl-Q(34) synthetase GluQRS [Proteobacteria bacterium]|jgi:glutamyl-Q tRNA(Asp) synthetase|nr:tRNA glutamyl-Q(34) synthetase GluQRS [Pseudomonadota bacterium]